MIKLPELQPPLVLLSACANRISLDDHLDLTPFVPDTKTETVALDQKGQHLKLVRERFKNGKAHFHLELSIGQDIKREILVPLSEVQSGFEPLVGKTLFVSFGSRFQIPASKLPKESPVQFLRGMGLKFNNTMASMVSANLKLQDSVFGEIRWRFIDRGKDIPPDFVIEIFGQMGQMPVTPDLLGIAMGRAFEGLHRFVVPPTSAKS